MKVIVCGGRTFSNWALLERTLSAIHAETPFDRVATGAAPGADTLADTWARSRGIRVQRYYAMWKTEGPAAGPIRNKRMLDEERPDLVIAFRGGSGTANMIEQAERAGVRVNRVE